MRMEKQIKEELEEEIRAKLEVIEARKVTWP